MPLCYTGETITNPQGIACTVLDTAKIDFSNAVKGRKAARTLVCPASGGELVQTRNSKGDIESVYLARRGDAIFINLHNPDDRYVACDTHGKRLQVDDLPSHGYDIVGDDPEGRGLLAVNTKTYPVLHEVVTKPTCIKDSWGSGQHQFLFPGASLKRNEYGRVTGIDKESFDATWEVIS